MQHEQNRITELGGHPFLSFNASPKFATSQISQRVIGRRLHTLFGQNHPAAISAQQLQDLEQQEANQRQEQNAALQEQIYQEQLQQGIPSPSKDIYRRVVAPDGVSYKRNN